jgi:hypothetical protein
MRQHNMHRARVVASVAATALALGCGTNVRSLPFSRFPCLVALFVKPNTSCLPVRLLRLGSPVRRPPPAVVHAEQPHRAMGQHGDVRTGIPRRLAG